MTNNLGSKPEGFVQEKINVDDVSIVVTEMLNKVTDHFIFNHPHEIVGCLYGQLNSLSKAADDSVHTGNLDEFRERCMKALLVTVIGAVSVDKLKQLTKEVK